MQVVCFCPHATSARVFGINLSALVPILGPSREALSTTNKAIGLIMLYHSHLAIEFYNFKFHEAPSIRKTEFGVLSTPRPDKASSSL